jgi:hypothetical protein
MPFPNEHACRIKDPGQFDKLRREKDIGKVGDKSIDAIWGIKGDKSTMQAIRYPKDQWTEEAARNHCNARDHISFEGASDEEK